jgi:hypothetical protein
VTPEEQAFLKKFDPLLRRNELVLLNGAAERDSLLETLQELANQSGVKMDVRLTFWEKKKTNLEEKILKLGDTQPERSEALTRLLEDLEKHRTS